MPVEVSRGTTRVTATVFLSYRRGSASGSAGRLYDTLTGRLGDDQVFMDVDSIRPGDDFVEILDRTLEACRAAVVVIDREWLDARDQQGRRRLDNPRDFVRLEVENALRHGLRIIPVLIDDAEMPSPDDLPPSMRALANRHALEISATRFRYDAGRLIDAIEWALAARGDLRNDPPRSTTPDRARQRQPPAPAQRRQGYAAGMMRTGLAWAHSAGATVAALNVAADNRAAQALYRGLGYRRQYDYEYRVPRAAA